MFFLFFWVPTPLHLGFLLFFLLHTSMTPPESSLSPSPLLFVWHSPTTCHSVLPRFLLSLLVSSYICSVRVLEIPTFILALQLFPDPICLKLSMRLLTWGFMLRFCPWVGSLCPFQSWAVLPLCFVFYIDGVLAHHQCAGGMCCWYVFHLRCPSCTLLTYWSGPQRQGRLRF